MTIAAKENKYTVGYTQNAKEQAEILGYDITGKVLVLDMSPSIEVLRGYVMMDGKLRGPVTLFTADVELVV